MEHEQAGTHSGALESAKMNNLYDSTSMLGPIVDLPGVAIVHDDEKTEVQQLRNMMWKVEGRAVSYDTILWMCNPFFLRAFMTMSVAIALALVPEYRLRCFVQGLHSFGMK